jgi:transcriptional repressor NrdR
MSASTSRCRTSSRRNGNRTEFDHAKLAGSMKLALRKRPVTIEAIDAAVDRIEARLLAMGEQEVPSEKIGELVMKELKKLDKVAYIRFASVYRNFADVDEFSEVIREVQAARGAARPPASPTRTRA